MPSIRIGDITRIDIVQHHINFYLLLGLSHSEIVVNISHIHLAIGIKICNVSCFHRLTSCTSKGASLHDVVVGFITRSNTVHHIIFLDKLIHKSHLRVSRIMRSCISTIRHVHHQTLSAIFLTPIHHFVKHLIV